MHCGYADQIDHPAPVEVDQYAPMDLTTPVFISLNILSPWCR